MITSLNGYYSSALLQVLNHKSSQMEDLTVQLGSGKRARTYGGLGSDVSKSLKLNNQLTKINGYQSTIEQAQLQVSMVDLVLERIADIGSEVSGSATATEYDITDSNQTVAQMTSKTLVSEILGLLDTEVDGDHIFSGTATDTSPTLNYDQIVYGYDGNDGLLTVTDERIRADAGADGMGRLATSVVGSVVTLDEEAADFGYKMDTVSSNLSNVAVAGPAGSPPSLSITVADKPLANESISFNFTLPDGSSEVITLAATNGATEPGDGYFSLIGTTDNIAAAIEEELAQQIKNNVAVEGEAASRIQAALDLYVTSHDGEPMRVVGSPPETATVLDTATAAGKSTVNWYVGENGAGRARDTATALIDKGLNISYGARANEDGIAKQLAYMTAYTLPTYDGDSESDQARYAAFADAISGGLSGGNQGDEVTTIQMEFGVASKIIAEADDRHQTTSSMLEIARDSIVGIDEDAVAAKIMTLQTTIEASYQATSMLYQLSLTKYI